jgi:hypothetical protein
MGYYDGTKLLSMSDLNGNKPELYLCTTNRTGGKTTFFNRLMLNRYIKQGKKFALLYRFSYELSDCVDKFFSDIGSLFFSGHTMSSVSHGRGSYYTLKFDGELCGYAIALNNADMIKKYSHVFNEVDSILFDEFQSETNHYCAKEIEKFISVHTSIARGQGKQYRYVPVYMLSNAVSIINPYYVELGIIDRLRYDTKFLKGDGYVLEQGFIETASNAQLNSGFNKAFRRNNYVAYAAQNVYLNDSTAFIEKPSGNSRYLCTIKYNGNNYCFREYSDLGFVFCDDKPDLSHPLKISVTTDDHQVNYVMLKKNDFFLTQMRFLFEKGCFRFKNLLCKEAALKALSY